MQVDLRCDHVGSGCKRDVGGELTVFDGPALDNVRRPPLFVYDPHKTGLGSGLIKSRLIRRTPTAWRHLVDARLIGQRLIVDRDGHIALDDLFASDAACQSQMERFCNRTSSLFHEDTDLRRDDGKYFSDRLDSVDIEIQRPVLSLLSKEPSNYGSWLFRVLPKLAYAEHIGLQDFSVACWCPSSWQKNLLAYFGINNERIIDIKLSRCYRFSDLHVPISPNPEAFIGDATLSFYRRNVSDGARFKGLGKYIYVSRRSHAEKRSRENVRYFIDEDKMIERVLRLGFTVVEPENLPVAEQIAAFRDAQMVVGASGAGMFNTIFCAPGTIVVDIEAFPFWLHAHANYFASCHHTYGLAFGKADEEDRSGSHKRWTIDTDALAEKIEKLAGLIA